MSPSRGSIRRLFYSIPETRRQLLFQHPHSPLQRTSHAFSLSQTSATELQEERFTSSSNNDIHPDGIDSALFESSTTEYDEQAAANRLDNEAWQSGPSQLLLSLLGRNSKDATTTLKELKKLETSVEHRYEYARPARQCAVEGDFKGCLAWLDVIPNQFSIAAESIEEREQVCIHIAATLTNLINSSAEPYIVYLALLKVISKGYIEVGDQTGKAIFQALTWLVRHGKVLEQLEGQEWTWKLWQTLVKLSKETKKKFQASNSSVTLDDDGLDKELSARLTRLYNACVRALVLSGRYEAATKWVQNSTSFSLDTEECDSGTNLQPFTWRIYLEEVLDYDSPASTIVRNQAGALAAILKEKSDQAPSSYGTKRLLQEMQDLVLDRNAETIKEDGPLDDRVIELLDRDDVTGSIALLHQALTDASPFPRWAHLPKATTLASIREAVRKSGALSVQEDLQLYLQDLEKSKGAKGLIQFSAMMRLSQADKNVDCVSFCISNFQAREIEQLAILVDKEVFQEIIRKAGEVDKLRENKYANYLALKSMVRICKQDFFKMNKLYRTWLDFSSHHFHIPEANKTTDSTATNGIFEDSNFEYLFSIDADLNEENTSRPLLSHQTPPHTRPTVFHFNLFLKMLPKALATSAKGGSSSVQALLQSEDIYEKSIDLAFSILKDMERYKIDPNTSTWSILLTLLGRNINAISPLDIAEIGEARGYQIEYESQWSRIWKITTALGMGSHASSSSSATAASPLPKATVLTYVNLIYAFLMVPPSRGGPCLQEALQVKQWLEIDQVALAQMHQFERPLNRVMNLLEKVQDRQREKRQLD